MNVDSPKGTSIFQTEEEYRNSQQRKDELENRYKMKIERLRKGCPAPRRVAERQPKFCLVCLHPVNDLLEHLATSSHSNCVKRDREIYTELDSLFKEIQESNEVSNLQSSEEQLSPTSNSCSTACTPLE